MLEAVAFGTFLRDVESHVDTEYALLTPFSGGAGGFGGGGGGGGGGEGFAGFGDGSAGPPGLDLGLRLVVGGLDAERQRDLEQALLKQMEMQKKLHEQLEVRAREPGAPWRLFCWATRSPALRAHVDSTGLLLPSDC